MKNLLFILLLLGSAMSCTSTQSANTTATENTTSQTENLNYERILVLLKNGIRPDVLTRAFAQYGLQDLGQTSRSENRFMLGFDKNRIKAKELLSLLKNHDSVLEAEFAPVN